MTVHAKYGIPLLVMSFLVLKDIKMLYIVSLLIILLGIYLKFRVRDRIVTGSFDKTAKLWDANTGQLL